MSQHVEIRFIKGHRSMMAERQTGLKTATSTVQVVYDFGEFEVTLVTEGWSDNESEMQALIRKPLLDLIESMKVAAEGEIVIPKPPKPPASKDSSVGR